MSAGVYCCVQKTAKGKLYKATKAKAKKAIRLWDTKVKSWTHKDFKLATSTLFVTDEACFPCHRFATRRNCYHRMAADLRNRDNASSCSSSDSEDDIIVDGGRKTAFMRGRPKKKRSEFMGERKWMLATQKRKCKVPGNAKKRKRPEGPTGSPGKRPCHVTQEKSLSRAIKRLSQSTPKRPTTRSSTPGDVPSSVNPKKPLQDDTPHRKFHKGYWLSTDDILYVMTALLGTTAVYAPTSYDVQARSLQQKVEHMAQLDGERAIRAARRSARWGQWTTQVTNCGRAGTKGFHWVLSSTFFGERPLARLWEPLSSDDLSFDVFDAFRKVCGPVGVNQYIMKQQSDGYSCGYITVWWALYQHSIIKSGGQPMESPPPPPAGWEKIVWIMLEAGQAGIGALDVHVYPFLTRLWNDYTYDGGQFVREVQHHITSAIYEAN